MAPNLLPDPLVVTLLLDPAAQAHFDLLRAENFPPERLLVGAHVTLFHALAGTDAPAIGAVLTTETRPLAGFPVTISALRLLGRGVAFALHSPALLALRARLRARWADSLTPQDRQTWQPHITVQNKVAPAAARALHDRLSRSFVPWQVTAIGLALWHYRGGPWQAAGRFPFSNSDRN